MISDSVAISTTAAASIMSCLVLAAQVWLAPAVFGEVRRALVEGFRYLVNGFSAPMRQCRDLEGVVARCRYRSLQPGLAQHRRGAPTTAKAGIPVVCPPGFAPLSEWHSAVLSRRPPAAASI